MTRAHYKVKVCQDQVYSVDELCKIYNVRRNAITDWMKSGLRKSDDLRPFVFRGAELQRYHNGQKRKPLAKLKQGEFNCLSCGSAGYPAPQSISLMTTSSYRFMAVGVCATCDAQVTKLLKASEYDSIEKCLMSGTSLTLIDESNCEIPADTGNKPDLRETVWYPTNDRIVHEWQIYAGRFETSTKRAHLRSIRMLEVFLGGKAFDKVTPKDAADFRDHLVNLGQTLKEHGGLGNSTIRHHASQVRQFFKWLRLQDGYKRLSQNIPLYLELPKAVHAKTLPRDDRDYLTIEQAEKMLEKMPDRTIAERRDRAMVACAYTSGLRAAALTTLRLKHIDLYKRELVQNALEMRAKNGKSFRSVFFPRTEAFQEVLVNWLSELVVLGFTQDDAVFPELAHLKQRGSEISPVPPMKSSSAVSCAFNLATSQIGRKCTPHSVRDTLKALGDELCTSPKDRKAWSLNLGHTNEKITEIYYGKMSDHQRRSIIEGLSTGGLLTAKENAMVLDFYESRFERGSDEYNMAKRLAERRAAARDGDEVLE
ncbi:tyrosine-type recombinase/integrase [Ruegeria sp. HKCCA4008]|uniref:tyrosine-type recombinase/integrase n=1 Tax=Ruegeria sp. HKCCA4008 TaxID=2682999 RepID=UPI0014878EC9|nr:tyrosine-type recombinase/integrase [Ruegeria sp. HKCCA4008]